MSDSTSSSGDNKPHVVCPHCGVRVQMRTLLDMNIRDVLSALRTDPASLEPEWAWGKPGSDRVIFKQCMKGKWVHLRVGKEHRLLYMRGDRA